MQNFQLGSYVHCFKGTEHEIIKGYGYVSLVQINSSGYIQYSVKVKETVGDKTVIREWQVNDASMARTAEELAQKIEIYVNFTREQRLNYERTYGKAEFDIKELEGALNG